jgi:hypothetical protein
LTSPPMADRQRFAIATRLEFCRSSRPLWGCHAGTIATPRVPYPARGSRPL